jgi:hypothetical protein
MSPGVLGTGLRTRLKGFAMPSLIDRVTTFGRSQKNQSRIRQAMSRLTGGNDTGKGRRRGNTKRRGSTNRRTRAARKR